MIPPHIKTANDLVTSHAAVCAGFLSQALTKTAKANPYVAQAHSLWKSLQNIQDIHAVAHQNQIRDELLAAAGFSDKARSHLSNQELEAAIEQVLATIAQHAPQVWREEIVYRYLLTRGDSLGGSMRNVTGAAAGTKFTSAIVEALKATGQTATVTRSDSNAEKIQSIKWPGRVLLFDKKPSFLGNNIDVILLKCPTSYSPTLLEQKTNFVACGELKGGIDPAGADEHWKTANSALQRIRTNFPENQRPALFFVGAAIEASMANEIFSQLQDDRLTFAANLTVPEHLSVLVSWLVAL